MKKLLIMTVAAIITTSSLAYSADVSSDTTRGKSDSQDQSVSLRTSVEKKISASKSESHDSSNSSSRRKNNGKSRDGKLDLILPFRAFIPEDVEYRQAADLGLAASVEGGGMINTTVAEWFDQAKKTSAAIGSFADLAPIVNYIEELARFGARAGQAQINLNKSFARLGAKKAKNGVTEVTQLGADDLAPLVVEAWIAAESITDNRIKAGLGAILRYNAICRFTPAGDVACGDLILSLSSPPSLKLRGLVWYGQDQFAGLSGNYAVSSSWSLSDTFEKAQGVSNAKRSEVSDLLAKGKATEAADSRRKSISKDRSSKASVSPSKFIPN
jgi:hypothetical protein